MELLIDGDLDFETAAAFREHLFHLLDRDHPHLTIDLSACRYVDSSGTMVLVAAAQRARAKGGAVTLRHPSPALIKMLRITRLGDLLGIEAEPWQPAAGAAHIDTAVGRWDVARFVTAAAARGGALARRTVLGEAAETPLSPDERADLELAVGEAFANAVRHGSPQGEADQVHIRLLRGSDAFIVEVSDCGRGFDRAGVALPGPMPEGGMGIFYMEVLMDAVEFDFTRQGTTVRLIKSYTPQP